MDADPKVGNALFVVLPTVFPQLAGGTIWASLFYVLLFMAALTSAISILEVVTAYFIDQKGWDRARATIIFGTVITVVGVFCSLSMGGGIDLTGFLNMTFFDFMDYLSSKYMLPIGGMFMAIFILYRWGVPEFLLELQTGMDDYKINHLFVRILLSISAAVVGFIILNEVVDKIIGRSISDILFSASG